MPSRTLPLQRLTLPINMKHEFVTPAHVVSLRDCELQGIWVDDGELHLGAMTTIQAVTEDENVLSALPALADACSQISGPQLRRMGTIGGNICLDTRCLYINQSHFWRSSLGFCIKKDGTACHVVAVRDRAGYSRVIRLSYPPQLAPMAKCRRLSTIAATASSAAGASTTPNRPLDPLKSRFQFA